MLRGALHPVAARSRAALAADPGRCRAHVKAKTEMLQLKLMEKRRALVCQSDVDALIDEIVGVTLTANVLDARAVCASWRSCGPPLH